MAKQVYIHNKRSNPYKIPFKDGTPYDVKKKVDGVVYGGRKSVIPSDVAEFLDFERLEQDSKRLGVKYRVKELKLRPVKTATSFVDKGDS